MFIKCSCDCLHKCSYDCSHKCSLDFYINIQMNVYVNVNMIVILNDHVDANINVYHMNLHYNQSSFDFSYKWLYKGRGRKIVEFYNEQ